MNLGSLARLSHAKSRSISAENVYGEKGRGGMAQPGVIQPEIERIGQATPDPKASRELGTGWKVRPCIPIPSGTTATIMDIDGPGVIQHIWMAFLNKPAWLSGEGSNRDVILRFYWDHSEQPSVEVPMGDFFCNGWKAPVNINAIPINVNSTGAYNCYFPMPFRKHVRITAENRNPGDLLYFFYTFNYILTDVPEDQAYFHAQFRRTNPLPYKQDYVILDGVEGQGQYVGTYMAWQQNNAGWWGEGEVKIFLDGDREYPTICGTGTEDYFGGAWCFGSNYSAPYLGYPEGLSDHRPGNRHGLYRFHVLDPIRFEKDIRVNMQALSWRSEGRYLPLQDDISSVAYWYQTLPVKAFPTLPSRSALEVI